MSTLSSAAPRSGAPVKLRTVFCTCGGLYGALVLRRLRACDGLELCAVIRSTRVLEARYGFLRGALAQVRRSGLAYSLYLWCVTTLADWLCALGNVGAVPTRSATRGICVLKTRNINNAEAMQFLSACTPDLLVSAFFNQRLHTAALALPKYGCINVHPSPLPDAKGVDPVFQTLLSGTSPLGVTVHFMSPEFDAGRIIAQNLVKGRAGSSVFATTARLFLDGAELLAAAMEPIARGWTGTPQSGAGSYQSWPTSQEVRALRASGGSLLRFADLMRLVLGKLP